MSARVYGTPARYGTKRGHHFRRLGAHYAGIAVLVAAAPMWVVLLVGPPAVWLLAMIPTLGLCTALVPKAAQHWRSAGRYARGAAAEREVVATARRSASVAAVFCGIQPGKQAGSREDIDVLLVLRTGLVLLCEVKHVAGGEVDWDGSNLVTGTGRVIPGAPNPPAQVLRQRELLLASTDLDPSFVKPMVVCSGATTAPFTVGPVLVTNTAALPEVLDQAGQRSGPSAGQVIKALRRM